MDESKTGDGRTAVDRKSERALVVTRVFHAPVHSVFKAWTTPALLTQWWAPKSFGVSFISCQADVRTGGAYRFVFATPASEQPMAFFGKYIDVTPDARLVWTNEEAGADGPVTTVTFQDQDGGTLLVMHDLYPTKTALDEAIASGSTSGFGEMFAQLDAFLVTFDAGGGAEAMKPPVLQA